MAHIHTQADQHDYTVGAYIVRCDRGEPEVLLHMHRKMQKLLPIGGHIELDETPWQAAIREIHEESGYLLDQLQILQPKDRISSLGDAVIHPNPVALSDHHPSEDHYHTDIAYGFIVSGEPLENPDEGESVDFRWVTRAGLERLGDHEIFPNTKDIYTFILEVCVTQWEKIRADQYKL